ncbi:MAG: AMP-binding protein [Polyangiaceae bacterium]
MNLRERVLELKSRADAAAWRIRTTARVSFSKGLLGRARAPGAVGLAREIAKGRINATTIFRYHAANDPHGTALVAPAGAHGSTEERAYSFLEVDQTIDRVASGLAAKGIRRGDAVLIAMKNRPEFILVQAAIGRLGASAVSVSWRSTAPEMEYIATHSQARALFFDATIDATIQKALPLFRHMGHDRAFSVGGAVPGFPTWDDLLRAATGGFEDGSDDAAVVMYTSGTTGKPKGAVRKFQREVLAHVLSFMEQTPMTAGDVHLVACPLYHATAFGFTTFTYILGGTVVVPGEFKPDAFLDTVERYRATTTAVVPTMLHRLLELGPDEINAHDLRSLRAIFSGGAPLSATLARDALDALGDKIYNFYGATETGVVTVAGPSDLRASPGTIGRVVPGQEVRLLDEEGREVPEGAVGEIYARSEQLIAGYHADDAATKGSMKDGFFSVGDLGRRDARGCYHVEGRKRDMIISGGINVYPAEVESVIDAHLAVLESAVVGVPDREWGERVRAYVVLRPGAEVSPEELSWFCAERLAKTKVPREFRFVPHLPRNPTGKVLKRELRELS